jgi:stalled ribosome alternative rescue factor ArfA
MVTLLQGWIDMTRIRPINPVAKALAASRRRANVYAPKRGKGSYNRKKLLPVIENYKDIKDNK